MKNNILTIAQASEKYCLPCPGTVRKWIAEGKLPAIHSEVGLIFYEEDLLLSYVFQVYSLNRWSKHGWHHDPTRNDDPRAHAVKDYNASRHRLRRHVERAAA